MHQVVNVLVLGSPNKLGLLRREWEGPNQLGFPQMWADASSFPRAVSSYRPPHSSAFPQLVGFLLGYPPHLSSGLSCEWGPFSTPKSTVEAIVLRDAWHRGSCVVNDAFGIPDDLSKYLVFS